MCLWSQVLVLTKAAETHIYNANKSLSVDLSQRYWAPESVSLGTASQN